MWNYKTPGIPDEYFERTENVPITKEEVRTIQISKARLKPGQTVYDIGCGNGSISIEAAFQVESSGKVLAIDYDKNAIELTKKNMYKFDLSNISVIFGNANRIRFKVGKKPAVVCDIEPQIDPDIRNEEIHVAYNTIAPEVFRINKDKSITVIADIFGGKRTDWSKKQQDTYKKIK